MRAPDVSPSLLAVDETTAEPEWLNLTVRDWAEQVQERVLAGTSWLGVPMLKSPLDAWVLQQLVCDVCPDVIVEIGSYNGGSTMYLAHILDLLRHGEVVSVDHDRDFYVASHQRITDITGDSRDPEVVAKVRHICANRRTLVVHDGNHERDAVLADMRAYAPLVTMGSYLIVEDGIIDLFPEGSALHPEGLRCGPLPAIETFVAEDAGFVVDSSYERYLVTWNPRGYLRRVRASAP